MKDFTTRALSLSFAFTAGVAFILASPTDRRPSSLDGLELHLQSVKIDSLSRLSDSDLRNTYLRATFGKDQTMEFGKGQGWVLNRGEARDLDLRIPVKPSWLADDSLEFKIELVRQGQLAENVLVRCAHVSREVNQFNRALQCILPGETQPFLTFRLAKPEAAMPVAQR
jgi:hypothetical protein